jgi:hypothetical protein
MKLLRGVAKVESFRHRDEVAELAQVNVRHDLPLMQ